MAQLIQNNIVDGLSLKQLNIVYDEGQLPILAGRMARYYKSLKLKRGQHSSPKKLSLVESFFGSQDQIVIKVTATNSPYPKFTVMSYSEPLRVAIEADNATHVRYYALKRQIFDKLKESSSAGNEEVTKNIIFLMGRFEDEEISLIIVKEEFIKPHIEGGGGPPYAGVEIPNH